MPVGGARNGAGIIDPGYSKQKRPAGFFQQGALNLLN